MCAGLYSNNSQTTNRLFYQKQSSESSNPNKCLKLLHLIDSPIASPYVLSKNLYCYIKKLVACKEEEEEEEEECICNMLS